MFLRVIWHNINFITAVKVEACISEDGMTVVQYGHVVPSLNVTRVAELSGERTAKPIFLGRKDVPTANCNSFPASRVITLSFLGEVERLFLPWSRYVNGGEGFDVWQY